MRSPWRSPLPYLTGTTGVLAGGAAGAAIGGALCRHCELEAVLAVYGWGFVGAVLGAIGGLRGGVRAVRGGRRGELLAIASVGFVLGTGTGAALANDVWQRHHMIVKLKQTPYECRHDPPYPRYCRGAKPYIVRHPTRDMSGWHAAAGGLAGGSAGALTVSTAGVLLLRRPQGDKAFET